MIGLQTPVELAKANFGIDHKSKLFLMGSCFTEHIAQQLRRGGFAPTVNPFGTLYNPISIQHAIELLLEAKQYHTSELFSSQGLYHSYDFHSHFSGLKPEETVAKMNLSVSKATKALEEAELFIFTWGSAYVYRKEGKVVANCHKEPEKNFLRELCSIESMLELWIPLLEKLISSKPERKFIFSVSPIRHLRDGAHGNQLSKATLHLFTDRIQELFPEQVFYFPAYEILQDELRDYRFYAEDMTHPAPLAIKIICERWIKAYVLPESVKLMQTCAKLHDELEHRPLHPDNEESKIRKERLVNKVKDLKSKHPEIAIELPQA